MEKSKKEGFFERNFEKIILYSFIGVFLISYTYKLGGYYYSVIPWIFFLGFITAALSIFGILLYPVSLIFQTLTDHTLLFLPGNLNSLYMILMVAMMMMLISSKKYKLNKDLSFFAILGFGITILATTIINRRTISFQNYQFIHYVDAILIFFVLILFLKSQKRIRYFCWLLLLGIAALVFRLYNHVYSYDVAIPGFENNYLARVLTFYAPFFLCMFLAEKKKIHKFMILFVLVFVVQGIIQLGSRASSLSAGIALLLYGIMNFNKKSTWAFLGASVVFFMFFVPPSFFTDFASINEAFKGTDTEEGSIAGRALVAEYGWDMFSERPITGHGVDHLRFEYLMKERYDWFKSGHNSYVIVAVEMGIFGLLFYISLFAIAIYYSFKASIILKKKDRYLSNIAKGTTFGLIALGINQYMLNNPWIPTAFIGFGLSSALYYMAKNKEDEKKDNINKTGNKTYLEEKELDDKKKEPVNYLFFLFLIFFLLVFSLVNHFLNTK